MVRKTSDLHFLKGIKVELVYGDLSKPEEIIIPSDISYFIHNASVVSDTASGKQCKKGILDNTQSLVKRIKELGISLEKFIYISSTLTLGFDGLNLSETNPGESTDFLPYAFYKKLTEKYLKEEFASNKFPVVIVRPGDVYGPKDRTSCAKMLKACDKGVPLIVGHGKWQFPYCYIDNLCQSIYLSCIKDHNLGKAYNVMTDKPITWLDFFSCFQKGLNKKQRVYVPKSLIYLLALINSGLLKIFPRFNPPMTYYRYKRATSHTSYDITETKKELDYIPDNNFDEQIKKIINWYLAEKQIGRLKNY